MDRIKALVVSANDTDIRDADAGQVVDRLVDELLGVTHDEHLDRAGADNAGDDGRLAGASGGDKQDTSFAVTVVLAKRVDGLVLVRAELGRSCGEEGDAVKKRESGHRVTVSIYSVVLQG